MLASELIKELQNLIEKHGDNEVTNTFDYVITEVLVNNDREDLDTYYSLEDENQSIDDYYYEQEEREEY